MFYASFGLSGFALVVRQNAEEPAVKIDMDNSGSTAYSLYIDSESLGTVINIDSPATIAFGSVVNINADALQTVGIMSLTSNSADTQARSLVSIVNDNTLASGAVPLRIQQDSTSDIFEAYDGAVEVFTIFDGGNVGIGATAAGTSCVSCLAIASSTAPTASITDGIQLFAVDIGGLGHELRVRDEAGNSTTLSPHNFSLFKPKEEYFLPWSYASEKDNQSINVDMYGAIQQVEILSGKHFIFGKDIASGATFTPTKLESILSVPAGFAEVDIQIASLAGRIANQETKLKNTESRIATLESSPTTTPGDEGDLSAELAETAAQQGEPRSAEREEVAIEQFNNKDLDLKTLKIREDVTVYGSILTDTIEAATALITHGDATIWGQLIVKGDVEIMANVQVKGRLTRGNERTGIITIPAGTLRLQVAFDQPLLQSDTPPIVILVPEDNVGSYWIESSSADGFTIGLAVAPQTTIRASWLALQYDPSATTVTVLEESAEPPYSIKAAPTPENQAENDLLETQQREELEEMLPPAEATPEPSPLPVLGETL